MAEIWKPVVGYETRFSVSNRGRVRSDQPVTRQYVQGKWVKTTDRIIKNATPFGYPQAVLSNGRGFHKYHRVCDLVLETFAGPRPLGYIIHHVDGDDENSRLDNLEYRKDRDSVESLLMNTPEDEQICDFPEKRNKIQALLEASIDALADIEHERWASWQAHVNKKCEVLPDGSLRIPHDLAQQYMRQIDTPYEELSEADKEKDREQVRKYLPTIVEALSSPD